MPTLGFRSIFSGSVGNVLEWYDFSLYAFLTPIFAKLFFPDQDHLTAIVLVFGVFAAGFIVRPIGGLFFGHVGDKYGRALALQLTVLCMSIPTLLIAFLPTHTMIGSSAVIVLVLVRLLQGLCMGGEMAGAIIYLGEIAPERSRGFVASFANSGSNIGILLATGFTGLCSHYLSSDQMLLWGWRLLYIIGGVLGLIFLYFRRHMSETNTFITLKAKHEVHKTPLTWVLKQQKLAMLRLGLFVCMGASLFYIGYVYLQSFLHEYVGLSIASSLFLITLYNLISLILIPIFGWLSDKWGRKKLLLLIASATILLSLLSFYWMQQSSFLLVVLGSFVITTLSTMEQSVMPANLVETYPRHNRYTGLALGYNIAYSLFGGTAPVIVSSLIAYTHSLYAPAYYLMTMALVSGLAIFFCVKSPSVNDLHC